MKRGEVIEAKRPRGGYEAGALQALIALWWAAWVEGDKKPRDLLPVYVYSACRELVARRSQLGRNDKRRYTTQEIQALVGKRFSRKEITEAIQFLRDRGLMTFEGEKIAFSRSLRDLKLLDNDAFFSAVGDLSGRARPIPVPRRLWRYLAGGVRPVLFATTLGHLARCLFLSGPKGEKIIRSGGCVSCAWIAETFSVNADNVKKSRRQLISLGLLIPLGQDWKHRQRCGSFVAINLEWDLPGHTNDEAKEEKSQSQESQTGERAEPSEPHVTPEAAPQSAPEKRCSDNIPPPLGGAKTPDSTPPIERQETLLTEKKDQKLAPEGKENSGFLNLEFRSESSFKKTLPTPQLKAILPEDLGDISRLLLLFEAAVKRGFVSRAEADRLKFVAAAEHARTKGSANPCGLFFATVSGRSAWSAERQAQVPYWDYLTESDDESARQRLKRFDCGEESFTRHSRGSKRERKKLSKLAALVRCLRLKGVALDERVFRAVRSKLPEVSKVKWVDAISEERSERRSDFDLDPGFASGVGDFTQAAG